MNVIITNDKNKQINIYKMTNPTPNGNPISNPLKYIYTYEDARDRLAKEKKS